MSETSIAHNFEHKNKILQKIFTKTCFFFLIFHNLSLDNNNNNNNKNNKTHKETKNTTQTTTQNKQIKHLGDIQNRKMQLLVTPSFCSNAENGPLIAT